MTTRIGIVSDVHASPAPLQEALEIFERHGVSEIICAGDIAGYHSELKSSIDLLRQYRCRTIIGNHDQPYLEDNADNIDTEEYRFLEALPETIEMTLEGSKILVVHAEPPNRQHGGIKLLDQNARLVEQQVADWTDKLQSLEYDLLIVGHTHQVFAQSLGDVFVVNPGSSCFNHSCILLTLPRLQVETFALSGKEIIHSWNFSYLFNRGEIYPDKSENPA